MGIKGMAIIRHAASAAIKMWEHEPRPNGLRIMASNFQFENHYCLPPGQSNALAEETERAFETLCGTGWYVQDRELSRRKQ